MKNTMDRRISISINLNNIQLVIKTWTELPKFNIFHCLKIVRKRIFLGSSSSQAQQTGTKNTRAKKFNQTTEKKGKAESIHII